MSLKFSANLSTMFREYDFIERFNKAKECGFDVIEIQSPYSYSPEDLKSALDLTGVECDLINSPDYSSFGIASDPFKELEFANSFQEVMPYYDALKFKKLHLLAGCKIEGVLFEDQMRVFTENLRSVVESDFLEHRNLVGLIEPICSDVKNDYFLNSFDIATQIIEDVASDQIKLLLDVFHLHKITGDVKENFGRYYEYAGHIQVSQDPGRSEPFHKDGRIDYDYVFNFLVERNHQDAIGLEYIPSGKTEESLEWIQNFK